jgi:hypothetical protein
VRHDNVRHDNVRHDNVRHDNVRHDNVQHDNVRHDHPQSPDPQRHTNLPSDRVHAGVCIAQGRFRGSGPSEEREELKEQLEVRIGLMRIVVG